jgi:tRNA dimethylallyltransferase
VLVIVTGPTGVGKTAIAACAALAVGGEVVCADSRQLFRGMAVGAAQPDAITMRMAPHHLYGVLDPAEEASAGSYREMARPVIAGIEAKRRVPFAVGGTGLYLRALTGALGLAPPATAETTRRLAALAELHGNEWLWRRLEKADPEAGARIRASDRYRIVRALAVLEETGRPISAWFSVRRTDRLPATKVALTLDRKILYERINGRCRMMLEGGMVDEARRLMERFGDGPYPASVRAIGYRHLFSHLKGEMGLDEAAELLARDTRRYAKRQMTWLRGEKDLAWVDAGNTARAGEELARIVSGDFPPGNNAKGRNVKGDRKCA